MRQLNLERAAAISEFNGMPHLPRHSPLKLTSSTLYHVLNMAVTYSPQATDDELSTPKKHHNRRVESETTATIEFLLINRGQ